MIQLESPTFRVRAHKAEDLALLYAMDQDCFPPGIAFSFDEMELCLGDADSIIRVAESAGVIVGFAIGRITGADEAHVLTLDVSPTVRRQRIGTILMEALHEEFIRSGAEISFLEVDVQNAPARHFYEGLEYKYVEVVKGYYQNRSDALRMARKFAQKDPAGPRILK